MIMIFAIVRENINKERVQSGDTLHHTKNEIITISGNFMYMI